MSALQHDWATTASRAQGLEIIAPPDSWISGPSRIFGLNSLDETECGLTGLNLNVAQDSRAVATAKKQGFNL